MSQKPVAHAFWCASGTRKPAARETHQRVPYRPWRQFRVRRVTRRADSRALKNVNAPSTVPLHRYADQSKAIGSGRPGMDAETFLGAILIAAWAAVVLRGLERSALAARKGRKWERAYLVGLSVGCAFGIGVVLSIKNPFGPGFLLAAGSGFAIWAFGRRVPEGKRKASIRSKRETGEDGLGLRSTE